MVEEVEHPSSYYFDLSIYIGNGGVGSGYEASFYIEGRWMSKKESIY